MSQDKLEPLTKKYPEDVFAEAMLLVSGTILSSKAMKLCPALLPDVIEQTAHAQALFAMRSERGSKVHSALVKECALAVMAALREEHDGEQRAAEIMDSAIQRAAKKDIVNLRGGNHA